MLGSYKGKINNTYHETLGVDTLPVVTHFYQLTPVDTPVLMYTVSKACKLEYGDS